MDRRGRAASLTSVGVRVGDVINRLVKAMNLHDLSAAAALFHPDYRSSQPAHPGRTFTGREQMRANWAANKPKLKACRAEVKAKGLAGDDRWFYIQDCMGKT